MATYGPAQKAESEQSTPSISLMSQRSALVSTVELPVVVINGLAYPVILTNMISGVLPVGKGGTGLDSLSGGRLLASNQDGTLLEELDLEVNLFEGLTENVQVQLNKSRRYLVNVPNTTWSGDATAGFTKSVTVHGMTANDNPIVGFVPTGTTADELKAEREAYGCMDIISTSKDSITIKCLTKAPTSAFKISILCNGS